MFAVFAAFCCRCCVPFRCSCPVQGLDLFLLLPDAIQLRPRRTNSLSSSISSAFPLSIAQLESQSSTSFAFTYYSLRRDASSFLFRRSCAAMPATGDPDSMGASHAPGMSPRRLTTIIERSPKDLFANSHSCTRLSLEPTLKSPARESRSSRVPRATT